MSYKLYALVSVISIVVRQFLLPNPFECFGDSAWLINIIVEPIIQVVSYLLVGLVYRAGSNPALGSFLFLLTYAALTGLLWLFGLKSFAWWWIVFLVLGFLTIVILIRVLIGRISERIYNRRHYWD